MDLFVDVVVKGSQVGRGGSTKHQLFRILRSEMRRKMSEADCFSRNMNLEHEKNLKYSLEREPHMLDVWLLENGIMTS